MRASQMIQDARGGESNCLGQLLESYRNYLHLLATTQIDHRLRTRLSPSDLVQETMLGAFRDFDQFQGLHERSLLAWLRQILINRLHVFVQRNVLAAKRDVRRICSFEEIPATSPFDRSPSPSSQASRKESAVALSNQLASLTSDHRDVIVLRNLKGLSFDEAARQMSRSNAAVRMLWLRAMKQLKRTMDHDAEGQP